MVSNDFIFKYLTEISCEKQLKEIKGRGEHRNNIPFGKQLTVLHTTKLANVEWSRYSGGNSDDSPPHGTQVVGPIHRPQTGECPAAEVYFFAKDCPSSALQHRRQVQQ